MCDGHRGVLSRRYCSMLLLSAGCQFFAQRSGIPTNYNLPLTVLLRMDPSIAAATIEYRDACGQAATAPIHEALQTTTQKTPGAGVRTCSGWGPEIQANAADGVVDVALGFREVNLFVPRKANKSYPATVTLGLDFSYTDQQGTVLHSKKLQSSATGEVEARADSCDISGLEAVAQEAITNLIQGMAQQLGTATKIREQAQFRKAHRGAVPPSASQSAVSAESWVAGKAGRSHVRFSCGGGAIGRRAVALAPATTPPRRYGIDADETFISDHYS